jgi:hypothetical protein
MTIERGDTADSDIRYLPPVHFDGPTEARRDPGNPALEFSVGGEVAALIEEHPESVRTLRALLVDCLRTMGDTLDLPAQYLAQARWEREHGRRLPWPELREAIRASATGQAHADLERAAELYGRVLAHREHTSPRVEVIGDRDPDGGTALYVFLDGVPITARIDVIDPGAGYTRADWEEQVRQAREHFSPAAAAKAVELYEAAADSKYIEDED